MAGRSKRLLRGLRQAWTGDRSEGNEGSHLFVPSRESIVICGACGQTEAAGNHDGSTLANQSSFI